MSIFGFLTLQADENLRGAPIDHPHVYPNPRSGTLITCWSVTFQGLGTRPHPLHPRSNPTPAWCWEMDNEGTELVRASSEVTQ